jgi:hypothetical protein
MITILEDSGEGSTYGYPVLIIVKDRD